MLCVGQYLLCHLHIISFITGIAMNSGAQNINNFLTLGQMFYLQFFQSKGGTDKNAKTLQPISDKTQPPLKQA